MFNHNFTRLLYIHMCTLLQNFNQVSLTLTKWCHIRLSVTVQWYFYISLEKREKLWYLCNWFPWNLALWCRMGLPYALAVKKINFKNTTWQTADALEKPILHHHQISWFFDFQDGGRPPFWIFKIKFLTFVHFRDMFCISVPNFPEIDYTVAQITRFFAKIRLMTVLNTA